jgi:hypothetical protein
VVPVEVGGELPLVISFVPHRKFGRHLFVDASLGYGFSRNDGSTSFEKDLVEYWQFTAGVGLRTVRTAYRKYEFRVSAGIAAEDAKTNLADGTFLDSSDSRVGGYVRAGAEWKKFGAYLEHGIGFAENEPLDAAIGWSDGLQISIGVGYAF